MLILEVEAYAYPFLFLLSSPYIINNNTNTVINSKVELLHHIDLIKAEPYVTKKIGIDPSLINWDAQRYFFVKIL